MMAAEQPDDAVAFTYCVNFGSAETKKRHMVKVRRDSIALRII